MDAAEAFRDLPGLALLESARPGRTGRWSYLAADPVAALEAPAEGHDPFAEARALLGRLEPAPLPAATGRVDDLPPFTGGLVGYLAYDLGRRFERLPSLARVDQHLPMLRLALHDWAIAWDRRTGEAWLGVRAVDGEVAGAPPAGGSRSRAASPRTSPGTSPIPDPSRTRGPSWRRRSRPSSGPAPRAATGWSRSSACATRSGGARSTRRT